MSVAEWVKSDNLSGVVAEVDVSALYLLARPSTLGVADASPLKWAA
jgi:hypothetical protein